jgi:hypothetical protein
MLQTFIVVFVLLIALGYTTADDTREIRSIEQSSGQQIGIWYWTWSSSVSPPVGTNLWIAFSGYTDVATAVSNSLSVVGKLQRTKILALGGGNAAGTWTSARLSGVTASITNGAIQAAGYAGVAYDIEEGDAGLGAAFLTSFQTAKNKGLIVIVTVSHSTPYGIPDTASLMSTILRSTNVDFVSPQLYTTGSETSNDYTAANGVGWNMYANIHAKVIPSIVSGSMYSDAQKYFANYGVTLGGYIQWAQSGYSGSGPSPTTPPTTTPPTTPKPQPPASQGINRCGKTWSDAVATCGTPCPIGVDSECPNGGHCFASVICSGSSSPSPSTPPTSSKCYIQTTGQWWLTIVSQSSQVSVRCSDATYQCIPAWTTNLYQCSPTKACNNPTPICTGPANAQEAGTATESSSTTIGNTGTPGWAIALLVVASALLVLSIVGLAALWRHHYVARP